MDITQLNTGLTKKFEQSRIVFWHDPEQSFTAQLADLSDPAVPAQQSVLALGSPTFDFFVHRDAHVCDLHSL
ncbi:hypothetical protein [Aeromonas caviae]|uniref:hypothetical protein n=1 Tax=Aeromonas caviae TaxID=648 RepID=UPI001FBB5CEF|nr:hypothetical protein [Aeromonas caviae]